MFFEIFIYFSPSQFSSQQQLQRIRRLPFRLLNGVDVAVGGFELGVAEAGGYVLDIRAVTQQQRRGGVAQGVKFAVRQVVALLELREPLRWRSRVHRLAVRLNENPIVTVPRVAESELQPCLFRAVAFEHGNAVRRQHDPPAFARLSGFAPDLLVPCQLIIAAADGENTGCKVDVAPFQPHEFTAAAPRIQRHMNKQAKHQRLVLKRLEQIAELLFGKDFRLLLLELWQGNTLTFCGIDADQTEIVGAFHQRANHCIVTANSRGRELSGLSVEVCVAL